MILGAPKPSIALWIGLTLCACFSCDDQPRPKPKPEVKTSPNASIYPQPLVSGKSLVAKPKPTASSTGIQSSSARPSLINPPPIPVPFVTPIPIADLKPAKATTPLTLTARFQWPGQHTEPRFFGLEKSEQKRALGRTGRRISIDLRASDRMSFLFSSHDLPLPAGSKLLARADRIGFLLQWPKDKQYRVLAPGMLRAILLEHRADVTPAFAPIAKAVGTSKRFGLTTEISELETGHGKLRIEQATVENHGYGGSLLCRMLLELVAISESSAVCGIDRVPVEATIESGGGKLKFIVDSLQRRTETSGSLPRVPPKQSKLVRRTLPKRPTEIFTEDQLSATRRGAKDGELAVLTMQNYTYNLAYLRMDGALVGFATPYTKSRLRGLRPGTYAVEYWDFFGRQLAPKTNVEVPGRSNLGQADRDAGAH